MTESTYNGWTNYPTWCVKLWLDNDQGLQDVAIEIAVETRPERYGIAGRANDLESFMQELLPDLGASFASDLLGHAMYQVNWYEIIESFIEDYPQDEDDDENADTEPCTT